MIKCSRLSKCAAVMLLKPLIPHCNSVTSVGKISRTFHRTAHPLLNKLNLDLLTIGDCVARKKPRVPPEVSAEALENLNEEQKKSLELFDLEREMLLATGYKVPETATSEMLLFLLHKCPTVHSRRSSWLYWYKLEKAMERSEEEKAKRAAIHAEKIAKIEELKAAGNYEDVDNRIMYRIRQRTMRKHYWNNLAHAMMNGPHLVLDCGFEDDMNERENMNTARQLLLVNNYNLTNPHPYHIHYCNLKHKSIIHRSLVRGDPTFDQAPMSTSEDCYLNHYPRDKLVYLSPNARVTLESVEADKVYIIGGLVDLSSQVPLTMAKAKRQKIRMAKLPLDDHVRWVQGSKALTMDQCFKVMLEKKNGASWLDAFIKHLPHRKFTLYGN